MKEIHYNTIIISILLFLTFCVMRYTFHAVASEQKNLSVTATVAASASDFQSDIAQTTVGTTFSQDKTITYEVTYGSSLSNSVNFDLVASWTEGTIGATSSTVDIVDYVTSSATQGYGNVTPVVDLTNRKITWSFSSFPANTTDQTVQFSLKTNSNYTGAESVSFTVSSKIVGPGVTTTPSTTTTYYQYAAPAVTPTDVPGIGPSATPGPAATSTPTPVISNPTFSHISIDTISDSSTEISFSTSQPTSYTIFYGSDSKNLTGILRSPLLEKEHSFSLDNLTPDTHYYFKIIAKDESGKIISSDIFTLTTAQTGSLDRLSPEQLSIYWENIPLSDVSFPSIITAAGRPISIRAQVEDSSKIASMKARFVSKQVLGISTDVPQAHPVETRLVEILPNLFVGELLTPSQFGSFYLEITSSDIYGGIQKQKLDWTFSNGSPLMIVDKNTNRGIEGARVKVARYDSRTNAYIPLDLGVSLSEDTDGQGFLDVMLPVGIYQLEISAPHYFSRKYKLDLTQSGRGYPRITLQQNTAFSENFRYALDSYTDVSAYLKKGFNEIVQSKRAHDLAVAFSIILFVLLLGANSSQTITHRSIIKEAAKHHHVTFIVWIARIFFIAGSFCMIITSFIGMPFYFLAQEQFRGLLVLTLALINSMLWIRYTGMRWKESES